MTLRRTLAPLALVVLSLATQACAGTRASVASAGSERARPKVTKGEATSRDDAATNENEGEAAGEAIAKAPALGRAVGDFIVYEFTGSFRKAKATLTERVIARTETTVSVLVTLTEAEGEGAARAAKAKGAKSESLRVTFAEKNGARGDVLEVSRADGEVFSAAEVADYEALVAKVTLAADDNEALLGEEESERTIAGEALACRTASYRVRLGKKIATLRTIETRDVAWGDVGGEITDDKGVVLFKADVVKLGRETPHVGLAALSR
jgi:hypothetical protein